MASLALTFDILARDNASKSFRDVGNSAERAGNQGSMAGSLIARGMKVAAAGLLGSGIIAGFKALYEAAAESQRIGRLTEAVIKSTGGAANVSAKQVSSLAAAIGNKTGVDDEAIQSGQNLLLTFTNVRNEVGAGNDIFNQATVAMNDMSVALGKDASSSAILLGKALNDPIKGMGALSRAGVQFTAQQREQITTMVEAGDVLGAQKIILAELGTQFGGAAEAASTPLDKLRVRAGNLAEQVGGYLVPAVDRAATFFSDKLIPALEPFGPILGAAVDVAGAAAGAIGDLLGIFASLPGPVQAGVIALGAFAALRGPVSGAMETIALRSLYMRDAIVNAGTGLGGFKAAGAGLLGFLGGPWGIAIGAATVGLGFLMSATDKSGEATEEAAAAQRSFADALRESNGVINENVRAAAAKSAQDSGLLDSAEAAGVSLNTVTDALLGNRSAYDEVQAALQAYQDKNLQVTAVTKGGVTRELNEQGEAALTAEGALSTLAGTLPATAAQQQQLAEATSTSGIATETFAQKIEAARTELDEGKRAIDDFKLALDILTGANVSAIQVESAFQDAVAQAQTAMKDLGGEVLDASGSLNLQSENGRIAADVLLDVRNSGNDLIATYKQQGETTEQLAARDASLRQSFLDTAAQMGITGGDAEILADQILGIPAERNTTITADTGPASVKIDELLRRYNGAEVQVRARQTPGFSHGGWTGPGSKFTPAGIVHADEFVVPKERVNALGGPRAVGSLVGMPGYAEGGPVSPIALRVTAETGDLATALETIANSAAGAGDGALGGGWQSIWNVVKAAIPQARQNSTFRAGDPGYHGRGKAIDFGFGTGPGGAGSAGLASINRFLHDSYGSNLAELIYDGIGDDRPDLKNGRPLNYGAATAAVHRNHVHAAVYDSGGILPPGLTMAYNGTGKNETIRTAGQEAALRGPIEVTGRLQFDGDGFVRLVDGRIVSALTGVTDRGRYNS